MIFLFLPWIWLVGSRQTKECIVRVITILTVLLFLSITSLGQIVNKVLVSGIAGDEDHEESVKRAFLIGYASYDGTEYTGEIRIYSHNLERAFEYADINGYQMMVRSTTGLFSGIYYADKYPNVELVMPAGSNSYVEVYSGDILECPVIVTGAGEDTNTTGYNIEFHSIDPITDGSYSSFSNGYVAGQIAYITNSLGCTIDEARLQARENGTEGGMWDTYNGFGKINIDATLTTTNDAFPVELTSFTANTSDHEVVLSWRTATEVNNYRFEVQRSVISNHISKFETIGIVSGHGNSNSPKDYLFIDSDVLSGVVQYRLKQIDNNGSFTFSKLATIENNVLAKTELYQNYPNPFNPSTAIGFTLAVAEDVTFIVYNSLGQKVSVLIDRKMNAGKHNVKFNATNLTSGLYFYTLQTEGYSQTIKMLLLR